MVGPGAAVDPPRGPLQAVAPVDGQIVKLHPHAFVVVTASGRGMLVHLGIDTVELKGEGDQVAAGAPLVAWDAGAVEAGGRSPVSPVIALDAPPEAIGDTVTTGQVEAGAKLFVWQ